MKKAFYFLTAFSFVAVSCSKEGFEPTNNDPTADPGRLTVVTGSELDGGIVPINETFTLSGKAAQLSYTYKVYAESPVINGLQTAATSVGSVGASGSGSEYVFVSWHTEGNPTGGAIAAYRNNGIDYTYVARVDFDDTDWHDLAVEFVSANEFTIYLAGQREPDSSGYLLATHKGAVAGKITFNTALPDKFDIDNYEEIPLESFGANGIVGDGDGNMVIVTGNGTGSSSNTGGIYKIDAAAFDFVSEAADLNDGEYVVLGTHSGTGATVSAADDYLIALNRTTGSQVTVNYIVHTTALTNANLQTGGTAAFGTLDNERNAAVAHGDSILIALGTEGLYSSDEDYDNLYQAADLGSAAIGVSYDAINGLYYAAAGSGGLHVIAAAGYSSGKVLINTYDLIGKFIPPTGAPFNSNFVVKDVNVYNSSEIAIASGNGGMFFVEQN